MRSIMHLIQYHRMKAMPDDTRYPFEEQ